MPPWLMMVPLHPAAWQLGLRSLDLKVIHDTEHWLERRKLVTETKSISKTVASISGCGASIAIEPDPICIIFDVFGKVGGSDRSTLCCPNEHVFLKDLLDGWRCMFSPLDTRVVVSAIVSWFSFASEEEGVVLG